MKIRPIAKLSYIQAMLTLIVIAGLAVRNLAETDAYLGPEAAFVGIVWGFFAIVAPLGLLGVALAILHPIFTKIDKAHDVGVLGTLFVFESLSLGPLFLLPQTRVLELGEPLSLLAEITCATCLVTGIALMLIAVGAPKQERPQAT